jgi:predicted adenylyl cyclase CyaB
MANASFKEIEIKVKVTEITPLMEFLKIKAKYIASERQLDTYYSPKEKSYLDHDPVIEWLRLRDESGKYSITYKRINVEEDGKSHSKDEYETTIGDLTQMEKLFAALDLIEIVQVDKTRQTYEFEDYEIAIDNVKELGDFVEIEYKGSENQKSPKEITDEMIEFLKNLKVGKIIRNYSGYPFQILFPEKIKVEEYN